jgi:anti-anti-sigma regulatory factor
MSHKFQSSIQHRAEVSYVKLGGVIDEDNELADLADKIPRGTAVIDLGEIERINSCGVRDWVNWLSKLETSGTRSVLVECSPAIVAQINLVNNFTGNGVVKSFYVPYFCPECDEEKVLLVEATDMGPPPHEPPTCRCDECDLVMDFDDMPDSYFAFLSNQKKLVEPELINGAMRDLARSSDPDPARAGKVRSRASQPNLSSGSKPSVPSLPSIQRTSTPGPSPSSIPSSGPRNFPTNPPSRPPLHGKPPSRPGNSRPPQMGQHAGHQGGQPVGQPGGQINHAGQVNHTGQMNHVGQVNHAGQMGQMNHMGQMLSGPNIAPSNNYGYGAQGHGPGHGHGQTSPVAAPSRSNAVVYILIAILIVAIGVLAYLVMTK